MTIPIGGVPPLPPTPPGGSADHPAPGFGAAMREAVTAASEAEAHADRVAEEVATGGDAEVHELMAATAKAQLSVDLLVQMRNRAVEAYQEIMRLQV